MVDRLIIFGDSALPYSRMLAEASLQAAARVGNLRVVALCDTGNTAPLPRPLRLARKRLAAALIGSFNREMSPPAKRLSADNIRDTARRHNLQLLIPPGRDINGREFIDLLKRDCRADLALSLGCRQIFGGRLLGTFERVVNGHDGLLPDYRGLYATAWSLYRGDGETGFTYHVMNEKVDGGNILLEDRIPVDPSSRRRDIVGEKMGRACAMMEQLLPLMISRSPGKPQAEGGAYYGGREHRSITTIDDPSALTWDETRRRMWAFGTLNMALMGRRLEVTALGRSGEAAGAGRDTAFISSDGVPVMATRFRHLPLSAYRLLKSLRLL
jgi:hypothetical protein